MSIFTNTRNVLSLDCIKPHCDKDSMWLQGAAWYNQARIEFAYQPSARKKLIAGTAEQHKSKNISQIDILTLDLIEWGEPPCAFHISESPFWLNICRETRQNRVIDTLLPYATQMLINRSLSWVLFYPVDTIWAVGFVLAWCPCQLWLPSGSYCEQPAGGKNDLPKYVDTFWPQVSLLVYSVLTLSTTL